MQWIYPDNVLGGAGIYHGLSLGDILEYTSADTFEKADYPGLRAIRIDDGPIVLATDLADSENITPASGPFVPWTNWTPTVSGFTVGTGSWIARYTERGGLVTSTFRLTYGATSTFTGLLEVTVPVAVDAGYVNHSVGTCHIRDGASASYEAAVYVNSTDEFVIRVLGAAGTHVNYVSVSDTVPMTWASGDTLKFTATHERANKVSYLELLY